MKVTYRYATVADVPAIVNLKLAPKDTQEALDGSGCSTTQRALSKCLEISKVTWVIEDASGIIGVFGLGSREGQVHPWLLGTEGLHRDHWFAMCRHGRTIVRGWQKKFPEMLNVVWTENIKVIRWLKWLGFGFPDVDPIAINGRNYLIFKMNGGT